MSTVTENVAGLPVGPLVDAAPAKRPGPTRIEGRYARIEALDPMLHCEGLWQAVRDDNSIWTYLAYGPFQDERTFQVWLEGRAVLLDPFSYVIVDLATKRAGGIVTLMETRPAMRVVEIGGIFLGTPLGRSRAATEAYYLMARYIFEKLGYRRYEWKCDALNARSRRAAERLGFTFEGVFRQHMIVRGRSRDTAWHSMLDSEWPALKARFERWLAPENFDEAGQQRVSLERA